MTPDHFTAIVTAWVTSIVTVVGAIIVGAISLYALYQSKIAQVQATENTARIDDHSKDIKGILREMPPTGAGAGTTAPVAESTSITVTSTEPPPGA